MVVIKFSHETEHDLQQAVHSVFKIGSKHGMGMTTSNMKSMTLKGKELL
jgi:hypothetical protein